LVGGQQDDFFTAENETLQPVYAMQARVGTEPKKVIADGFNTGLTISGDRKTLAFERSSLMMRRRCLSRAATAPRRGQLTHENESILAKLDMNAPETFWFESADGTRVQAMMSSAAF